MASTAVSKSIHPGRLLQQMYVPLQKSTLHIALEKRVTLTVSLHLQGWTKSQTNQLNHLLLIHAIRHAENTNIIHQNLELESSYAKLINNTALSTMKCSVIQHVTDYDIKCDYNYNSTYITW
jgi:hypothetical protein